ncbi:hypothetical protein AAF712_016554, partial [Marasmius tenuissimus]
MKAQPASRHDFPLLDPHRLGLVIQLVFQRFQGAGTLRHGAQESFESITPRFLASSKGGFKVYHEHPGLESCNAFDGNRPE